MELHSDSAQLHDAAELAQNLADVKVETLGLRGVDHHARAVRDHGHLLQDAALVEERHLLGQLDAIVLGLGRVLNDGERIAQVVMEHDRHADYHTDADAAQVIGGEDARRGGDEPHELLPAVPVHLREERGLSQLEADHEEDRRECCQRDHVQQRERDRRDRESGGRPAHAEWEAAVVWSCVGALVYQFVVRPSHRRAGVIVGLAVLSHWILDLVVHVPDLALYDNSANVGFGLWNAPRLVFGLEAALFLGGIALCLRGL